MSRVYRCDVCGEICNEAIAVSFASSFKYCDPYELDLCRDCAESVSEVFNARANKKYGVGRNLDDFLMEHTI